MNKKRKYHYELFPKTVFRQVEHVNMVTVYDPLQTVEIWFDDPESNPASLKIKYDSIRHEYVIYNPIGNRTTLRYDILHTVGAYE